MEQSTAVNVKEKRTIPILQNNKNKMTWTPEAAPGHFLGILIIVITFKAEQSLYAERKLVPDPTQVH